MRKFLAGVAASTLMTSPVLAQSGQGVVNFTVEVTGKHNVPNADGGFRNIMKKRVFRGTARLRYAGPSAVSPQMKGFDPQSYEREFAACERDDDEARIANCQDAVQARKNAAARSAMTGPALLAALRAPRADVWATDSCSGELEIADTGTYRGMDGGEGQVTAMRDIPYTVTGKEKVAKDAADGCAFSLTYDPAGQTAQITVDPGPGRVEAVERTGRTANPYRLNPFDWTALHKFEKKLKVGGTRAAHNGVWVERTGKPRDYRGPPKPGEQVETTTRITWSFAGQPPS